MIAHVAIRRIAHRDYFWVVKDFYGNSVDHGHSPTSESAEKDARASKNDYIAKTKAMEKKQKPMKGKKWGSAYPSNWKRRLQVVAERSI